MMNDVNLKGCSPRAGHSKGFIPSPFRAIFRSASSLASSVCSAGSSVVSTITSGEEDRQCEQLQWACFDKVELPPASNRRVLLLSYANGFQVWDVENADDVREIVSKRDGPAAFLRVQPHPVEASDDGFKSARPLLIAVTSDIQTCRNGGFTNGYSPVVGSPPLAGENFIIPNLVKFYSLQSHSYVHTLRFRTAIFAVRCSSRVVAVSLATQLYCYDAATLQSTFSVLTYPSPQTVSSGLSSGYGAVAVGPRWLAYAGNQPPVINTGRVSPQHLSTSPSAPSGSGSLLAHYAKESSKQLAAGIVVLGDLGYRALSRYYSEGNGPLILGGPFLKSSSSGHSEYAGTVIVCDFVTKLVVSHFRAHDNPLSAMSFDPTGTLLVTASIRGHAINIFRIMPSSNLYGSSFDTNSSHVHLYKLYRGVTDAVIQDIAFSKDSHWIVVSSAKGTSHLFAISPFGGAVGKSTHEASFVGHSVGPVQSYPWWSNLGPLRSSQHASAMPPPSVNLSVVSRIKDGNGAWRATVSAATNIWNCSSSGVVAVVFHDGQGHNPEMEGEGGQCRLKEQLWVLSNSGHLTQHALHLAAGTEAYADKMASDHQKEALDLKVTLEPLQKWDLCRRPNWVEREEALIAFDAAYDEVRNSTRIMMRSVNDKTPEREESIVKDKATKETHQWFLSNAEVQMHHLRPPIWANSQFSFHVLYGDFNKDRNDGLGGEVEIEKVGSHAVEIRKRDLVPVFDMFKGYQFGGNLRRLELPSKKGLNSSSLEAAMGFGTNADVKGLQDHTLHVQSQLMNSSLLNEPQNVLCAERGAMQGAHYHMVGLSNAKKDVISTMECSPPMDNLYLGCQPPSVVGSKMGMDCSNHSWERERTLVPWHAKSVAKGNDMPCEARLVNVGCLCSDGLGYHASFKHIDPAAGRSDTGWVACTEEDGCPSSQTLLLDKTHESLPDAIQSSQNLDLQGYDAAKDVESTGRNSNSQDFGREEAEDGPEEDHAEDGWEGAMFPFVEDC